MKQKQANIFGLSFSLNPDPVLLNLQMNLKGWANAKSKFQLLQTFLKKVCMNHCDRVAYCVSF